VFRTESSSGSAIEPLRTVDDRQLSSTPSPRASPIINRPTPTRLLESGVVFRLEDFALYRVSSAIDERRNTPRKFISSDKKQLLLPKSMSSVHLEFTDYYFPDSKDLPGMFLPPDKFSFILWIFFVRFGGSKTVLFMTRCCKLQLVYRLCRAKITRVQFYRFNVSG